MTIWLESNYGVFPLIIREVLPSLIKKAQQALLDVAQLVGASAHTPKG